MTYILARVVKIKIKMLVKVNCTVIYWIMKIMRIEDILKDGRKLTKATEVVILVPPAAPITSRTSPKESVIIVGHIDDNGRFPGSI